MKKLIIGTVGLMVLGLLLLLITKTSYKKDNVSMSLKVIDTTLEDIGIYENNYLYFEYPKVYQLEELPIRDGRVYANLNFIGNKEKVLLLTLLFRESTQSTDELVDVKMRRANTFQYAEEFARIGDYRGILFRTADRRERVAYFMKKGRLLVVTMITNGPFSEEMESEFQGILDSVRWK